MNTPFGLEAEKHAMLKNSDKVIHCAAEVKQQ